MTTGVTTPRAEYAQALPSVQRNIDAATGQRAVKSRNGGLDYLPPLPSMCVTYLTDELGNQFPQVTSNITAEGMTSYKRYLSLAYFYAATGRTITGLTGLIQSKEPTQEFPDSLEYLEEDATGSGMGLRELVKSLCRERFIAPRIAVLVDHPRIDRKLSVKQREQLGLVPRIIPFKFQDVINWHYETVDGNRKLSLVVLKSRTSKRKEGFKVETVTQYRVLELINNIYHASLYDEHGELIQPAEPVLINGKPSDEITFYFSGDLGDPAPLEELVDANLNHYRFFADYAAKESASAFPVFYETGATGVGQNVAIGPGAKWENTNPDAKFGVIQSKSDGGSMRNYLLDMEQRMAALGAEMLKPRINQAESAEAKSLDQVAQNSVTADIAKEVSSLLETAMEACLKWLGQEGEVMYQLNTDYNPTSMNSQQLTALFNAYQGGGISYETFYENLQRGEIASTERTAEEELGMIQVDEAGL